MSTSNGYDLTPRFVFVHALCGKRVYREATAPGAAQAHEEYLDRVAYDQHIAACVKSDRRSRE